MAITRKAIGPVELVSDGRPELETYLLPGMAQRVSSGILLGVALRCLLVDDSTHFLEAASALLERQGIAVVGVASTKAEALSRVRELRPEVTILDVDLNGESGFDVAWELAAIADEAPTSTILASTHRESDLASLVAVTPVLGFIHKSELSAGVIRAFLGDCNHGRGCRHEALVYSSEEELAAGSVPFLRRGLAGHEHVLVVLREERRAVLEHGLGEEADRVEFADAVSWYQSPEHALQQYTRCVGDRLERGASRVRVVAEVIWPESSGAAEIAGWKRYEAGVSAAMAAVPVSFICTYDTRELPTGIVTDARRMHPVLRTASGPRPNADYMPAAAFLQTM